MKRLIITCGLEAREAFRTNLDVSVAVEEQMFQMQTAERHVLHHLDPVVAQVQPLEVPQINKSLHLQPDVRVPELMLIASVRSHNTSAS